MDRYLLENLAKNIKIASLNIVRENMEIELLDEISRSSLNKKIVFYGGTALRLAYNSPRFSEDLDFLMISRIESGELKKVIGSLILKTGNVTIKEIKDKRNTLFCLINVNNSSLKYPINIKIEICKKKNGIKSEFIPLNSVCSHLNPIVLTATLESLQKTKESAIEGRSDPKDWFDYWYICKLLKQTVKYPVVFPFNKKEFERELKRFLPSDKWQLIKQIYD